MSIKVERTDKIEMKGTFVLFLPAMSSGKDETEPCPAMTANAFVAMRQGSLFMRLRILRALRILYIEYTVGSIKG